MKTDEAFREKIARLNDLEIVYIQITLDGSKDVHDTRRVLAEGGPTFTRILDNISALMDSDYAGVCNIRVSVDKLNLEAFLSLRKELQAGFEGKKLFIYPAHVDDSWGQADGSGYCIESGDWANFNLDLDRQHGMLSTGGFYPEVNLDEACAQYA